MNNIFIILLVLLTPHVSQACFGGPQPAPGYGNSVPYIPSSIYGMDKKVRPRVTDVERDKNVWIEMGYFDSAPSGWGEIKQISDKYYHVQINPGGPGSCGPQSMYIYKKLLNNLFIALIVILALLSSYSIYTTRRKRL